MTGRESSSPIRECEINILAMSDRSEPPLKPTKRAQSRYINEDNTLNGADGEPSFVAACFLFVLSGMQNPECLIATLAGGIYLGYTFPIIPRRPDPCAAHVYLNHLNFLCVASDTCAFLFLSFRPFYLFSLYPYPPVRCL